MLGQLTSMLFILTLNSIENVTNTFNEVIKKHKYAFVKFYSPSCPACVRMKETFEKFENNEYVQKHKIALLEVNCVEGY